LPDSWRWPLADELRGFAAMIDSAGGAKGDRAAYEGAREDLLDWKGRAQRAERTLRGLGYTGIDASEAPQPAEGDGAVNHAACLRTLRKGMYLSEAGKAALDAAIAALSHPAATAQLRNMQDGATFEDYRDQLAVGNLTPVDQM